MKWLRAVADATGDRRVRLGHMMDRADDTARRQRLQKYHRGVLDFALQALDVSALQPLLQRSTECVSSAMEIERVKVLCCRPESSDLLVIAGVGWKPGVVGTATLPLGMRSPPGRSVETRAAVIITDLPHSDEFDYSDLLREHEIVSLVNVPIEVHDKVWGVLEVDSSQHQRFDQDDQEFLCGFAMIIGRTIELKRRDEIAMAHRRELAIELREREVLFAELRHRLANQLHVATGILEVARRRVTDPATRGELERVIGRVASMVSTNEQLSLAQLESEISLGVYLTRLCEGFARDERIDIVPRIQDATVTLRVAVRLGIIVNELVTNAIKHAFDREHGTIAVNFAVAEPEGVVTVADNGHGIRGDRPGGAGTGLVASLAEQIGATVEVATGKSGTAVSVRFPLRRQEGSG